MNPTPLYDRVLAQVSQHLSRITAVGALERAARRAGTSPQRLSAADLPQVIDELARSLSLYLQQDQHASLVTQLTELAQPSGEAPIPLQHFELRSDRDVANAVSEVRRHALDRGASGLATQKLITAVSELARNVVIYAKEGTLEVRWAAQTRRVEVSVIDNGPGITGLPSILAGTYKSKTGLGKGLRGVRRLAERMDVDTGPHGTRIVVEFTY